MNESKTPRSDKAASRDYAPLSVPYEIACQIESDLFAARNAALSEGIARGQIETELAAVKAERDMWKANHDNQVKLKSAIMDRPDLGDRARKVTALSEQLAASHAREAQLREALERCHVALPDGDDTAWEFLVTLPPPPVVPLEIAKELIAGAYSRGHNDTVESCYADPDEVAVEALEAWRVAK